MNRLLFLLFLLTSPLYSQEGWYSGKSIGITFLDDRIPNVDLNFSPGISTSLTMGYHFCNNWRSEIQVGYTYNRFTDVNFEGIETDFNGSFQSMTGVFNSYYFIPFCERYALSVGVGVGAEYQSQALPCAKYKRTKSVSSIKF